MILRKEPAAKIATKMKIINNNNNGNDNHDHQSNNDKNITKNNDNNISNNHDVPRKIYIYWQQQTQQEQQNGN